MDTKSVKGWNPGEYLGSESHSDMQSIIIVGARRDGNKKYFYFIKTNKVLHLDEEFDFYVMSYDRLIKGISKLSEYLDANNVAKDNYALFNPGSGV